MYLEYFQHFGSEKYSLYQNLTSQKVINLGDLAISQPRAKVRIPAYACRFEKIPFFLELIDCHIFGHMVDINQ